MNLFRFAHIEYLNFLLVIPVLIILFIIARILRKKALEKYGDMQIISTLMPEISTNRPFAKFVLVLITLSLIIIAIAQPQSGSKLQEVKREGVEIIIALDVSNSMMAQDIIPNRLENAKRAISSLIKKLKNDKLGLIVFAGEAYTQVPITTDYRASKMFLETVSPGIVPTQGTAIGAAIKLATKSFSPDPETSKVIVVITDGENHEDDAIDIAGEAADQGIIVHTIGMGLPEGSPIPKGNSRDFRKDRKGGVIISRLNETMLQQIAASGKGIYVRANNSRSGLSTILDEIEDMEAQEIEAQVFSEYKDHFQYYIGFALLFILLEFIILERKNRLFKNLKLFN